MDADACSVTHIVEEAAQKNEIEVILFCDTNHILHSATARSRLSAPELTPWIFCTGLCLQKRDIVVTQDYGVAAMALGKGACGIHQNGRWYTEENIDQMLMERHLAKKAET